MGGLERLLASLSPDPAQRGREFERITKWFLESDPRYRAELERVWLWDEWPGRWGADAGIDLVAKDRTGGLWAIQAKAYAVDRSVTKADVDTFLSESSRADFRYRLLVATTDRVGTTALRTLEAQEKPTGRLLLGDLRGSQVSWPDSPRQLSPSKPARKHPRPHQRRAIRDVTRGLSENDHGKLVMACGTGKTLVSLNVAEALNARRVLVLLPSLSLLSQTLTEWTANAKEPIEFLAVCSDEKVADVDSLVANVSDLCLPVTTESTEIARFLRRRGLHRLVVFSTYQSSRRISQAMLESRVPKFDLAVADEAHRVAGRMLGEFATILDPTAIRAKKRLFMTATPRYFTGRVIREAKDADFEVASMDDESKFGPLLHSLTFARAIELDLLTDYQVVIVGVDDDTYLQWARERRFVTIDGTEVINTRTLATQIGLAKAMRKYDLRRAITFHSRVSAARRFSEELPRVLEWMPARQRPNGSLSCSFVSGAMNAGERNTRLQQLRDPDATRALLSNARCLTEGIDVPTLDAVAFIDPRRSEVDIVQAVGRAIRKSPDKKLGSIVIPVFIGLGDDETAKLDASDFRPVWDILKALRAHDEVLAEEMDHLRRSMGATRSGDVHLPSKIILDLPKSLSTRFVKALHVRVVESCTSSWEEYFGSLTAFAASKGHPRVPVSYTSNGLRLGAWVSKQRQLGATMPEERRKALEAIHGWAWDYDEFRWQVGLTKLEAFVAREGHALVPDGQLEDGFPLGQWVRHRRGARPSMSSQRQRALEALPKWTWDKREFNWDRSMQSLRTYVAREGSARVPRDHIENGFKLGGWVALQRGRRATLSQQRQLALEALPGWVWNVWDERSEQAFEKLAAFVQREGHARVRLDHIESGFALGTWVSGQRSERQKGRLPPERIARLEAVPGWDWKPGKGPRLIQRRK